MAMSFVHIVLVGVYLALELQVHRANDSKCETVNFNEPALLGGTDTIRGQWPFIVALQNRSDYVFCGGTIISIKHILTGAHCIQEMFSEVVLSPNEVVVRLGAYNLTNPNEEKVISRNVSDISMHPDYDAFSSSCDADIAILILSDNVPFNDYIQPVRMPSEVITGNMQGTVVGYSNRKKTIRAESPRQIVVEAVSRAHCYRQDTATATFTSNRTFCGGHGDGSPDLGDSGSGYFFASGVSWAQHGIVSLVRGNGTGHIIPDSFHVYTNVTIFKDWIIETVNRTGGVVGGANINITMRCDYTYEDQRYDHIGGYDFEDYDIYDSFPFPYSCELNNIDIQGDNLEIGSLVGKHLDRKTHEDVEQIHFVNGTMSYLPSGFGLFFKNIKHLIVGEPDSTSMGLKIVRGSDLRDLRNLQTLTFFRNDIDTLHGDALWDLPNLQFIAFRENKLKVLFNETFSRNKKLWRVDFQSNQINFLPPNLFRNNPKLKTVNFRNNFLKAVDEKFFKTNRKLSVIFLSSNELQALPERLFRSNVHLRRVNFEGNFIKKINVRFFEKNRHIEQVDLSSNLLEKLPKRLFHENSYLRKVSFKNNFLSSIDEDFFETITSLEYTDFGSNRIKLLHQNLFRSNKMLREVYFQNNFIKEIHKKLFQQNKLLRSVNFSSNQIETLPKQLFRNKLLLKDINFESNALSSLDKDLFETNHRLWITNFTSNDIDSLPRGLFRNNFQLRSVDFRNNSITKLDKENLSVFQISTVHILLIVALLTLLFLRNEN